MAIHHKQYINDLSTNMRQGALYKVWLEPERIPMCQIILYSTSPRNKSKMSLSITMSGHLPTLFLRNLRIRFLLLKSQVSHCQRGLSPGNDSRLLSIRSLTSNKIDSHQRLIIQTTMICYMLI